MGADPEAVRLPADVLFVSHDGGRLGAPLALLRFLRWAVALPGSSRPDILLLHDGPLHDEFAAVGPVSAVWSEGHDRIRERIVQRIRPVRFGERIEGRRVHRAARGWNGYRLAYLNSVASAPLVRLNDLPPALPTIAHIHELEFSLTHDVPAPDRAALLARADRFCAVGDAVRDNLVRNHAVDADRVDVIPGFVSLAELDAHTPMTTRADIVTAAGFPADALLVGACGLRSWRKGADLFIQTAARVRAISPRPICFLWLGDRESRSSQDQLDFDVARSGLGDRIRFVDAVPSAIDYIDAFDVFCLPSREDPFPTVCLEAAARGKPIVCFDAGGATSFAGRDAGIVVPPADVDALARALVELLEDPARARAMGAAGAAKVRRDHDLPHVGPRILSTINRVLERR